MQHRSGGYRFVWLPIIIFIAIYGWNIVDIMKWSRRDTVLCWTVTSSKTGLPGTNMFNARQQNSSYRDIESFLNVLARKGLPMELQDHLSTGHEHPPQQCPQLTNGTLGQLIQHYHTERLINESDISGERSAVRAALTMRAARGIRDEDVLPIPHMLHQSLMRYANATRLNKHVLPPAFTPFGQGCSGEKAVDAGQCGERDLAAVSGPGNGPFCPLLPSHDQHILVTDCGLVESCYAPNASQCYKYGQGSYGTTYAAPGIMHQQVAGHNASNSQPITRTNYQLNPDVEVQELDELAAPGAIVWPAEPGHFTNEILPALVLLDRLLPAHIPLLWPATVHVGRHGDALKEPLVLPTLYLQALQEENGLKPGRPIIELNYRKPILYRAKRLYVFWSAPLQRHLPVSWLGQRLAAHQFNALAHSRFERLYGKAVAHNMMARAMYRVVVLKRAVNTRRSLQNHDAVVTSIKNALGPEFEVDEYQPDGLWPAVERLNKACFVVGPHGANLNNMLFLNSNCKPAWVVEVGYVELGRKTTITTAYLCMARNLGYKYYMSLATQGDYVSPLVANTEEIFEIASAYKRHVAAVQRGQPNSHDEA